MMPGEDVDAPELWRLGDRTSSYISGFRRSWNSKMSIILREPCGYVCVSE